MLKNRKKLSLIGPILFTILTIGLIVYAMVTVVSAQTVLQGYASDEKLQRGMLVVLKDGDESKIAALTNETAERFKGVVVEQNDSPVTFSSSERNNFVATVGPYEVLVSDENGPIKRGNYISISSNPGIGTKATETQAFVVGVAAADFTGSGDAISSATGANGQKINLGRIKVDVAFGKNPNVKTPDKDKIPDALQKLSNTIADKPVNSVRIYIGLVIFLVTTFIAGTTLFSGVRSGVISIGRNPLSKASIYRGLIQVVLTGLIIFLTGIFGVYLVLKL